MGRSEGLASQHASMVLYLHTHTHAHTQTVDSHPTATPHVGRATHMSGVLYLGARILVPAFSLWQKSSSMWRPG